MNIAILTFANLPLPAVKGGAIETLIDNIIYENEKYKKLNITTYSVYDSNAIASSQNFKYTKCKFYRDKDLFSRVINFSNRVIRKVSNNKIEYISQYMKQVIKDINRNNFDYVIVEGGGILIPLLKKNISTEIIMYFHSDPLYYLSEMQLCEIIKSSSKIFCVSNFVAERVLSVDRQCQDKISVIFNCSDLIKFKEDDYLEIRKEMKSRLSLLEDDIVVTYCGRIDPIKGVKELLLAFEQLKDDKIKLLIIGSPWSGSDKKSKYFVELERISQSMKDRIYFTGYIEHKELPKYYAVADIAVVPSICNEAAGLSVIEALSMGIPLIASNMGGIPEYCNESNTILIDYNDCFIDNLSMSIEELSYNALRRSEMSKSAKLYSLKFDTKTYYDAVISSIVK